MRCSTPCSYLRNAFFHICSLKVFYNIKYSFTQLKHGYPFIGRDSYTKQPADRCYEVDFWLCTATIDPEVKSVGQENAYKEIIKTAVGGAAGVTKAVDSATTDCQPNENLEALRVFMLSKEIEARPVWKPMHKQPVYADAPFYTNGVEEDIFKVGFCLPACSYVTDDDIRYIVQSIKDTIVK